MAVVSTTAIFYVDLSAALGPDTIKFSGLICASFTLPESVA